MGWECARFFWGLGKGGCVSDVEINIGRDGGQLSGSPVTIGDVAGGNMQKGGLPLSSEELLQQRVLDLERFVFGDEKLGIVGIRSQLQGLRFWSLFNVTLTMVLIIYEIFRLT